MKTKYPNIESERSKLGLSKEEFSAKIGITRKCYYNWQTVGRIPASKISEMADLFDCSVDYLLGRSDVRKYAVTIQKM
ncbi:helix-turn-helix transcriptional regulator [Ruminococcus sp.]|uniref:helix-turn-helix domain-containing protein n=1 Tax=Ruminococcus sp. TaxID=41978 RepID=UPI0025E077D1|nr:helix-turn-helix transcriptional regulator [Ruminococcus sp.]